MSISSFATLPVSAPAAPPAAIKSGGPADPAHATHFAQILSRGKAREKDAGDSTGPVADKADTEGPDGSVAGDTTTTQATDPSVVTAAPAALDAAANEGVSAVLALIGSIQLTASPPPPSAAPPSGTDEIADVAPAGKALPARLFTIVKPSSDPTVTPSVEPAIPLEGGSAVLPKAVAEIPTPAPAATRVPEQAIIEATPLDGANLPAVDLQLLRSMTSASSDNPKTEGSTADAATSPDVPTSDLNISSMAKALNQAFGQVPQPATPAKNNRPVDPKAAMPAEALAAIATDTPATQGTPSGDADTPHAHDLATSDVPLPAFAQPTDAKAATTDVAVAAPGFAPAPAHGEQSVTRHLDMLRDTQWLDRLAQDISQASAQNGHLKFQLNPEHLGSLAVEITNGAAGASIRMTTDNDNARAIIADAQPRLIAEVRAQGLRIAESHVDLGNQAGSGHSTGQRPSSEDHKPFVRTQIQASEEPSDSAPRDDDLYA